MARVTYPHGYNKPLHFPHNYVSFSCHNTAASLLPSSPTTVVTLFLPLLTMTTLRANSFEVVGQQDGLVPWHLSKHIIGHVVNQWHEFHINSIH